MSAAQVGAWLGEVLDDLLEKRNLSAGAMTVLMEEILRGTLGDAETAALLVALRAKGETSEELAAAARVLRRHASVFPTNSDNILDTCGTGGDGSGTFNISTATALVVAGAGVAVVKHGNRAVSSTSGSADVLTHLGVQTACDSAVAQHCLESCGMAFCFAPSYHPALRHVGDVRRRLRVRTLFNCLGPLANPAGAPYQLLGVGRRDWLDRMAGAVLQLGTRRAVLVHGEDGLDEVTLTGPTLVRLVEGGVIRELRWLPGDFGLAITPMTALQVSGPAESSEMIRAILAGEDGPPTWVVLANAAAALFAAGAVNSLMTGMAMARMSINEGKAAAVLAALVRITSEGRRGQQEAAALPEPATGVDGWHKK